MITHLNYVIDTLTFHCGTSTVTDHEGNVYHTVKIGDQCWMRDNLRTTTSPSTGTYLIPAANANYTITGKQAFWYNNDSATYAPMNYGLLYNWNAAVDTFNTAYGETSVNTSSSNAVSVTFSGHRRGICPAGWHLPSDAEWTTLTDYVSNQSEFQCGGISNYIAKALASTEGWNTYTGNCAVCNDSGANNATGFSAVPAGTCSGSSFYGAGYDAYFWSSTQSSSYFAFDRSLGYNDASVYWYYGAKDDGRSVRCLRDETGGGTALTEPTVTTSAATDVTETSATLNGSISNPDNVAITAQGFEWKATAGGAYVAVNATGETMTYNLSGLAVGTSYTYRAFVTTAEGTSYGGKVEFTTTSSAPTVFTCGTSKMVDADGNEYETVQIGTQCWTKTNLRSTKAADGSAIPAGGSTTSSTAPYYYNYSSHSLPLATRGYLYNWPAANQVCPTGWHLPSDAEWTTLTDYVSSQSEFQCGGYSNYIAKALASTEGWNTYTSNCVVGYDPSTNNATGFSAVPAGNCDGSSFNYAGYNANFWSSTQYNSGNASNRNLYSNYTYVTRYDGNKVYGRSVRCLRD